MSEFHTALGQFLNYRDALDKIEPERLLYLALRRKPRTITVLSLVSGYKAINYETP